MKIRKLQEFQYLGLPLSPDSRLYIRAITQKASVTVQIGISALDHKGEIVFSHERLVLTSVSTLYTEFINLGYSAILSIDFITATNNIAPGDTWISCDIITGRPTSADIFYKNLCQGYIATNQSISYGSNQSTSLLESAWRPLFLTLPNPPAGSNFSYAVRDYTEIKVLSIGLTYTADATAANRAVTLKFTDNNARAIYGYINFQHVATVTKDYTYFPTVYLSGAFLSSIVPGGIPPVHLTGHWDISSSVTNIQATDQISNIYINCLSRVVPYQV